MRNVVDFEARLRARQSPVERLERASNRLAGALSARRQMPAPEWLADGIARMISALKERRLDDAADLGEKLVRRAEDATAAV